MPFKYKRMKKTELIDAIKILLPKISKQDIGSVLETFTDVVIDELKNDREVTLVGFGTFLPKTRHARKGVDPRDPNKRIDIPQVKIAKFKTGKKLKDALKGLR